MSFKVCVSHVTQQLPQENIPAMQALQIDHHGPVSALTTRDVPRPVCSPQEVLILDLQAFSG
jgi:hypothetical protein